MNTTLTLLSAVALGFILTRRYPFPDGEFLVQLIRAERPWLYLSLSWSWLVMMYTTSALFFAGIFSLVYIFGGSGKRTPGGSLPPFPMPADDKPIHLVIGEVHHQRKVQPVDDPGWLKIPERGLFTGIAVFGSTGSGKTTAAMRPFAEQIFSWRALDEDRRIGGLVLEVKGDFCYQVRDLLRTAGREADYIELSLDGKYRYNPLHSDQDAFALAYSIATLLNQLYGKSKEPFWQQAYTNLVKFVILLHKVVDDYCTLFNVYECSINTAALKRKIDEGDALFAGIAVRQTYVFVDPMAFLTDTDLEQSADWKDTPEGMRAPKSDELLDRLDVKLTPYRIEAPAEIEDEDNLATRLGQFEAVKRWYAHDWLNMKKDLRTSIVEGISVFLSLFDDNQRIKQVFCPPKECYDPVANADGRYGVPLPTLPEIIESGRVLALNFPLASNPAVARMVACLIKQDFQRSMMDRIPMMAAQPRRHFRESAFICDEYHALATTGESDPNGDERFFALSRQSKCIAIVATQSLSSLRSALPGESWRTLMQCFRTKLFLAVADDFTAKVASDMAGRVDTPMPSYSISESGQKVRVSMMTGRTQAHDAGLTLNKSYSLQMRPLFEPKQLMELGNAQCVVIPYDGVEPLAPTLCFLKPFYLDRNKSYFEQRADGEL